MKKLMLLFLSVVLLAACTTQDPTEKKIERLLSQMTLDEKIGQMNQLDPTWLQEEKEAQIRAGQCGSVFNLVDPQEINRLQHIAVDETRLGIPLVFARDVIHGFRTIYPIPLGQGATWNPDLIEQGARLTAQEAVSSGIRWAFSPMVDVARDPRWGRVAEGYGEDTYLTAAMGAATVRGYQNLHAGVQDSIIQMAACVKHFAGYSVSEGGRDYNTTPIPETYLRDIYLPTFKASIDAGAASVMCSFNDINGTPSSANRWLNVDVLRTEWNFDGLLVSDWGSGSDLVPHGYAKDKKEAALQCINARMEMDMQGMIYADYLKELLAEGKVQEKQIDDCVRSILRLKYRLGLFDNPYCDQPLIAYSDESLEAAQKTAEESAILLKNNGILPLRDGQTVLVCGPLAHQQKEQLGTWIFDGEAEHSVTPLMAFRELEQQGKIRLLYEEGLTYSRDKNRSGISRVQSKAKQTDVVLFFAGEEAILSGEARCRADLNLPGIQQEMMDALYQTGKPVVLVVMAGRPLTIKRETEQAAAVLYAFHGGTMAGPALANVLTGKVVPSGKTPITFPQTVGQVPLYYNKKNTGRPTSNPMLIDDIPVGCPQFSIGQSTYWLETGVEPLFPFGYGLSYTQFEYSDVRLDKNVLSLAGNDNLTAVCTITNTGRYDAAEVAQLYIRDLVGACRPLKELKGFEKVWIPAGESREVKFTLSVEQLKYWHEEKHDYTTTTFFAVEPGEFLLWIAPNSNDLGEAATFEVK